MWFLKHTESLLKLIRFVEVWLIDNAAVLRSCPLCSQVIGLYGYMHFLFFYSFPLYFITVCEVVSCVMR